MASYRPKKRLGQNFLTSPQIIGEIIALVAPQPGDTIVEIGPGRGALTLPLAQSGAALWAVEFDRDLVVRLLRLVTQHPQAHVINADFLQFEPSSRGLADFKLIGNIPYSITSPVIDWCLRHAGMIQFAVLMVQKELAARISASPGAKAWAPLSIFTQMCFQVERCLEVAPRHFQPPPKVTSTVIKLTPLQQPGAESTPEFERVVRVAFAHRRKTLLNNLVPELIASPKDAKMALQGLSLVENSRAEELSIAQFLSLTELLGGRKLI